jgi:hypothetical protein
MVEILLFFIVSTVIYGFVRSLMTIPQKISNEAEKVKNVANYGVGEWITAILMFVVLVIAYYLLF